MGANLITYIVVGPPSLPYSEEIEEKIKKHLAWAMSALRNIKAKYDCADETGVMEPLSEQEEEILSYFDVESMPCCSEQEAVEELLELLDEDEVIAFAKEFCDQWPLNFRDCNQRGYGDKIIVVAGDTSWGDTPGGEAYTMLDRAYKVGLFAILGLE